MRALTDAWGQNEGAYKRLCNFDRDVFLEVWPEAKIMQIIISMRETNYAIYDDNNMLEICVLCKLVFAKITEKHRIEGKGCFKW